MPTLEVTDEMIGPDRTRLGLAYFESVMLWPHDERRRSEWMKAASAASIREAINAVPAARRVIETARFLSWYDLAREAMPLRILEQEAEQPFIHGVLAGELLFAAIETYTDRGVLKLEALKAAMVAPKRRKAGSFRGYRAVDISRSSLENTIWGRYKPVSHLWAAFVGEALLHGEPAFPCVLDRLPHFLGLARLFAEAGTRIPIRGRNFPVLDADRLWRFPPGLDRLPSYARDDIVQKISVLMRR